MIYLDSSIALAYLLTESPIPSTELWNTELVSSRLLEYEVWNRIHARGLGRSLGSETRSLLAGIALIELSEPVLARALEAWPTPIRTLDALHLATIEYLRMQGDAVELASYDNCLVAAAKALRIPLADF